MSRYSALQAQSADFFITEGKKGSDFLNASSAHLCFGSITVETSEQRVALIFSILLI